MMMIMMMMKMMMMMMMKLMMTKTTTTMVQTTMTNTAKLYDICLMLQAAAHCQKLFTMIDIDGDGNLTEDEFLRVITARKLRRRRYAPKLNYIHAFIGYYYYQGYRIGGSPSSIIYRLFNPG